MSEFKFGNLNYKLLLCCLVYGFVGRAGYNCFHGPAIAPSAAAAPARCLSRGVPSTNARYGCISMLDTSPAVVCGTTCRAETVAPACLGGLKL